MVLIYGSVGYSLLKGPKNKILIYADKHDDNAGCNNDMDVAGWMQTKFTSSNIILEEVPRNDETKLEELWPSSYHTQNLKNLYLTNPHIIKGSDIRTYLVPFSWELVNYNDHRSVTLLDYLKNIDDFFSLKNEYCIRTIPIYRKLYNTLQGKHFLMLKNNFRKFLKKYKSLLVYGGTVYDIKQNNSTVLEELNEILNGIMEWFTIANIDSTRNNVIHVGLAHSEKIVEWLIKHYGYTLEMQQGINHMKYLNNNASGCVLLSQDIDKQFGGKL